MSYLNYSNKFIMTENTLFKAQEAQEITGNKKITQQTWQLMAMQFYGWLMYKYKMKQP